MDTLNYRLAVLFDKDNSEYNEFFQNQIDSINKELEKQKRNIEIVEVTPDNLDECLADGAFNGITYFTDMHKSSNELEQTFQELIQLQDDLDIFPLNHERDKDETQQDLAENEKEYINSINPVSNVFSAIKVNNANEMKAVTNIMNLGVKSCLDRSTDIAENVNSKIQHLMDYVNDAINSKHDYTSGHVARTSDYAVAIAKSMGYDDEKLEQLALSAKLHDIGKLGIEDDILASNQNLTDEQRDEMSYHTVLGPEILKCIIKNDPSLKKSITKDVIEGVGQHHNHWDGFNKKDKEHPIKPNHDDVNEFALIICAADCLDTMTSQRAYNCPKNIINVLRDLYSNRDKMFRADIAETTILVLGKQLAEIGYDISEFVPEIEETQSKLEGLEYNDNTKGRINFLKTDIELKKFLIDHSQEFIPSIPPKKEYTDLGFKLDEKGHFAYENGPKYNEPQCKRADIAFKKNKFMKDETEKTGISQFSEEEIQQFEEQAINAVERQYENNEKEFKKGVEKSQNKHRLHSPKEVFDATKNLTRQTVQEATTITISGVKDKNNTKKENNENEK